MTYTQIYLFGVAAYFLIIMGRFLTREKVRNLLATSGVSPRQVIKFIVWSSVFWPLSLPTIVVLKLLKLGKK